MLVPKHATICCLKHTYMQMSAYYLDLASRCKSWPTYHSEEDSRLQEGGKSRQSVLAYALARGAGAAEDTGKQAAQSQGEAMQSEKQ